MAPMIEPVKATRRECALLDAAKTGDLAEVRRLLADGVNPNARDHRAVPWDITPLMHASKGGHLDVAQALVMAGADLNLRDRGIPRMETAVGTALHYAVNSRRSDVARFLIESGANIRVKAGGDSILGLASYRGLKEVVELLLVGGANPNARGAMNRMPLHDAAAQGFSDVVRLLLTAGANPNATDETNKTPLYLAVAGGHPEIARNLLDVGADPNIADHTGVGPLAEASCVGNSETVNLLVRAGASVNSISDEGLAPLDYASRAGNKDVCALLREHGAEPAVNLLNVVSTRSKSTGVGKSKK